MRDCLVLGSGRSGTSMVAGTLATAGYFMGGALWPARAANPKGFFEGPAVNGTNEALLAPVADPDLGENQRWLSALEPGARIAASPALGERMAALTSQRPFCFKDPRFCYTLAAWEPHLHDPALVVVFRHPALTARSIVEEVCRAEYLAGVQVDHARAVRIWTRMYASVLAHRERGGDFTFLHFDQVLTPEGLDRIASFTGADVDRSFPDRRLHRPPPELPVPPEAMALYGHLCELAGFAPAARLAPRPPRGDARPDITALVPADAADAAALPAVVASLRAQRGVHTEVVVVDRTWEGSLEVEGAAVVHAPELSLGLALRRGLDAATGRYVALADVHTESLPNRLAHLVEHLDAHPEVGLLTSALAVSRPGEGFVGRLDPSPTGEPVPLWAATLAGRPEALARVAPTAFHPVLLALVREAAAAGTLGHVDEVLVSADESLVQALAPWAAADGRLVDLAARPHAGPPALSVSLCSYNRRPVLAECLQSFCRQELPPGAFEIVLVDDGSSDGTDQMLDGVQWPVPVRHIRQVNGGLAAARNAGLAVATGEVVLFINDDTIASSGLVQAHVAAHRELAGQKRCVLGTFEQPPEALDGNLMRYLERSTEVFDYAALEPGRSYDGFHHYTCNVSTPLAAVREAGCFDESFRHYGCEDTDLGVRLEALGYRVVFHDGARALHRHLLSFDDLRRRQHTVARAYVRFFRKHPHLLARWQGTSRTTAAWCRENLATRAERVEHLEAAARTLAAVDLGSLERLGGELAAGAEAAYRDLGKLITALNPHWWNAGFLEGFAEHGVSGFPEILATAALDLGDAPRPRVLVVPPRDGSGWLDRAEAWLRTGQGTLVVRAHPVLGPPLEGLEAALRERVLRSGALPAPVLILRDDLPAREDARLLASVDQWMPSGGPHDTRHRELAANLGVPELDPAVEAGPIWPLPSDARLKVLAWPHWEDPAEVDHLVAAAAPLVGVDGVCLVLRHDPERDGSLESAMGLLQESFTRAHGDAHLDVVLEQRPIPRRHWAALGRAVNAQIALPSTGNGDRVELARAAGARPLVGRDQVADWVRAAAAVHLPVVERRATLQERADALHPWFYPVTLGGYAVTPGIGSPNDAEFLTGRTAHRATLLVDEVTRRIDVRGKAMLDVACNCAHWGSRYALRGLARYVGVEGRQQFVDQARLYWDAEGFLPQGHYAFLHGNALDAGVWERVRTVAPFDLTLCAGLLYHLPEYRQLLAWVAQVTREAMVIDTRVGGPEEALVVEPGDVSFNAIEATRAKRVPHLPHLVAHLHNLGFEAEVLEPAFGSPYGLRDVDDYAAGNRVTLVARRVA